MAPQSKKRKVDETEIKRENVEFTFDQDAEMLDVSDSLFKGLNDSEKVKAQGTGVDEEDESVKLFANTQSLPNQNRRADEYILVDRNFNARVKGKVGRVFDGRSYNNDFCRLYRDGAGNYYTSPLAYNRIEVPNHIPEDKRNEYRRDVWNRVHYDMRIPGQIRPFYERDENIKVDKNYRLKPEDKYIQTPGGPREVEKRYQEEFQAGATLPDIMIKTAKNDIHFIWRFPGDKFNGRTFQEFEKVIKAKFGEETEIKLKSKSGIMHDSKYLDSWEKGSADIRFGEFAGETRAHNTKLPHAIVNMGQVPDGKGGITPDHYVSINFLMKFAPESPWAKALKSGELSDRVQLLARNGNQYMPPAKLNYSDPDFFKQRIAEVGLPPEIGFQSYARNIKQEQRENMPPVLVAIGPELKEPRALTEKDRERMKAIAPLEKSLLIADHNSDGHRNGNYTSAAEYQRKQEDLPQDAAKMLGLESNVYSRDFVPPNKATRPIYDGRERNQGINSIA